MKELKYYISMREAAKLVGVTHQTFNYHYLKGNAPAPDAYYNDNPVWEEKTILAYAREREKEKSK